METHRPAWYEMLIGAGMLAASVYAGMHIVHHPEHEHLYAWMFVSGLALIGLWMVAPLRARTIWRELRDSLPFLEDTHHHEE